MIWKKLTAALIFRMSLAAFCLLAGSVCGFAQSIAPSLGGKGEGNRYCEQKSPIAEDWQTRGLPQTMEATEEASKKILQVRGSYFDSLIPLPVMPGGLPNTWDIGARPELPIRESDAILIGQFTCPLGHLSPSEKSVYFEVVVKPSDVLKMTPFEGKTSFMDPILMSGGAVRSSTGRFIQTPVNDALRSMVLGHVYLIFLRHIEAARFYQVIKTWDVTSGRAVPVWSEDQYRAKTNVSNVAGIPLPDLTTRIKNEENISTKNPLAP